MEVEFFNPLSKIQITNKISLSMKRSLEVASSLSRHKKYKVDLVSRRADDSSQYCFNNLVIHILPSRFGPGRLKILENQVTANGGHLFQAGDNPDTATHVVAEETLTEEALKKCCQVEKFFNAVFVKCSWLVTSVKHKELQIPSESEILYSQNLKKTITLVPHRPENSSKDSEILCTICKEENYEKDITAAVTPCQSGGNLQNNVEENRIKEAEEYYTKNSTGFKFTEKFACAHSSSNPKENPNEHITDELEKLSTAYESKKDKWRAVGYQKAIAAIKNYPKPIESWEEARNIRGVGERLADKIKEIIERGALRKVKEVCDNEETKSLQVFIGVWGAGATTANNWYAQGFRTLEDLRLKAVLTKHQEIGLKYYEDFNERMSRSEVEKIEAQVKFAAQSVCEGLEIIVCGSYRRGRSTCGDVDILVTHPDGVSHENIFIRLLDTSRKNGFLTDDLVIQEHNGNQQKYLGVCKLPEENSKHRRLDIIVVPYKEYAPALMYFTGSAHFNRSMRLLATKLGMSLSEHGLRKGVIRDGKDSITGGTLLDTPTEESIFNHLGLKYRPPNERNH